MLASLIDFLHRAFGRGDAPPSAPEPHRAAAAPLPSSPVSLAEDEDTKDPILNRRDVLDGEMNVIGYQLALRTDLRSRTRTESEQVRSFLDTMLIDQLARLDGSFFGSRRRFMQLWESSIIRLDPRRLPVATSILVVPTHPGEPAPAELKVRLATLRANGIEIWLEDCAGTPWFNSLVDVASGCVVRMALRLPNEIAAAFTTLRRDYPGFARAAWDIGTQEEFEFARDQGCAHFQGGFVTRRNDWSGRALSPQVLAVAALINELRQGADMREIAQVLKQDMAMSYRLLRYVNTAARGLNQPLSSIEQALMILGQEQLDRWLTLLMLGGGLGGNAALMEAALVRARFLELLGEGRLQEAQCERLFVLGLFSMLDVALQVPLEVALQPLHLPEAMSMALLKQKGPFGSYLALVEAVEKGQSDRVLKHSVAVGLTTRKVNARHLEALAWVNEPESTPVADEP